MSQKTRQPRVKGGGVKKIRVSNTPKENNKNKRAMSLKGIDHLTAELDDEQSRAYKFIDQNKVTTFVGTAGSGKSFISVYYALHKLIKGEIKKVVISRPAVSTEEIGFLPGPQPLDAKILTPDGWSTMGEMKVGSKIIAKDGTQAKVIGVYPKGIKDVYRISTTDGTSTECCEDHLWYTSTSENKKRKKNGSVKSTKEIMETIRNKNNKLNHFIPRNEPVNFNQKELPLPPYFVGALLGDGHIGNSLSISGIDMEIINRVGDEAKYLGYDIKKYGDNQISYTLVRDESNTNKVARKVEVTNIATNELKERFVKLGLQGKRAWEKFIPDVYKYGASVEDRLNLVRGLMDTDGTCKKSTGEASFTTVSERLAMDLIEIVKSLGGNAVYWIRDRIGTSSKVNGRILTSKRITYEVSVSLPENMNPFYASRKAERYGKKYIHGCGIKSIELVGRKEVQCIMIDNPEHLYITDNYIVTHNTVDEKMAPYLYPIYNNMYACMPEETINKLILEKRIEILPVAFIRGVTFKECITIVDEGQNLNHEQLKMTMTRLGIGSKLIITGDRTQTDLKGVKSGFDFLLSLKNIPGYGVMKLVNNHRDEIVTAFVKAYEEKDIEDAKNEKEYFNKFKGEFFKQTESIPTKSEFYKEKREEGVK